MSHLEYLDLPTFGLFPFDHFIMEQWDPASTASKEGQKRSLVTSWIQLGKYGRNIYYGRFEAWDGAIPDNVPQDLLTDDERKVNGQLTNVLWIRTWYGNGGNSSPGEDGDVTQGYAEEESREAADASYRKLWRRAFLEDPDDEGGEYDGMHIPRSFFFDDSAAEFGVTQRSKEEKVAPAGTMSEFVVSVLMRCPDQMEGTSAGSWRSNDEETVAAEQGYLDQQQTLLLMVADRRACEDGWVLQVAINHKGEMLPGCVRAQAARTREYACEWLSEGVALDEITEGHDVEIFLQDGDGWGDD